MKILGIVLIVVGVIGIGYGGVRFAYQDKIVDAGPLQVTVTKHQDLPVPPILGALACLGGVGLLVAGSRKAAREQG